MPDPFPTASHPMRTGQNLPQIILPSLDGREFNSDSLKGKKHIITFFRFATCPFCNLRLMELSNIHDKLGENFEIVGIFPSEIEHLRKHTNKHTSKFPILSDCDLKYYRKFRVKKSFLGMIKGIVFRMPSLWKSMKAGNVPLEISSRVLIMPLSLLVDEKGIVQEIYHGKDEGDHIPIDRVVEFSKAVSEPLGGANGIPLGGML